MNCYKCNKVLTKKEEDYCREQGKEFLCYKCQKEYVKESKNLKVKILKETMRFKLESLYDDFRNTDVDIKATQSHVIYNPIKNEMCYILVCYYE